MEKLVQKSEDNNCECCSCIYCGGCCYAVVLSRPTYQELTRCEDYNEMNTVTSLLTDNGYTYQIDNMAVKVKEQDLTNAKMLIASNDIKPSGYSLDDALNSSLTTTESDKNKKYAKYLD